VPDRAVKTGAWLVSERGPVTVTLEAVGEAAGAPCIAIRYSAPAGLGYPMVVYVARYCRGDIPAA